jgi:hypothetical protein
VSKVAFLADAVLAEVFFVANEDDMEPEGLPLQGRSASAMAWSLW